MFACAHTCITRSVVDYSSRWSGATRVLWCVFHPEPPSLAAPCGRRSSLPCAPHSFPVVATFESENPAPRFYRLSAVSLAVTRCSPQVWSSTSSRYGGRDGAEELARHQSPGGQLKSWREQVTSERFTQARFLDPRRPSWSCKARRSVGFPRSTSRARSSCGFPRRGRGKLTCSSRRSSTRLRAWRRASCTTSCRWPRLSRGSPRGLRR